MTLQLYILRQLLVSFGFSLGGIGLIVLPTVTIQAIHKLGAVSIVAVFAYLPLVLVELVPYVLPMAFLLGVVSAYGRLAADRELIAVRMAGIHPARIALPGLVVAIGLSLWTHHLLTTVSPEWKYDQRNFIRRSEKDAFMSLAAGRTELEFGDCSLKAERAYDGGVFEGVLLDLTTEEGEELTVSAAQAELSIVGDTLSIHLRDAFVLSDNMWTYNAAPFWSRSLSELFPTQLKDRSRSKYRPSSELRVALAEEELTEGRRGEYEYELNRRRALSLTYVLFLLLGVPTGVVLRSGTQLAAFTWAVTYAFLYYVLALRLGQMFVLTGFVPPSLAAWVTHGLFLVLGLVLFQRAMFR